VTLALKDLRPEFRPMFKLAWPVVLSEIGWMLMGLVDTIMVGRVSPEAIGGVSIGSVLHFTVAVFGMGLLLGLDTLVSQAFGGRRLDECHAWLLHGVYLSLGLLVPLTLVLLLFFPLLPAWGIHPAVLRETFPYFGALVWGLLPLLLFSSFRRYLQAMNQVKPILFAMISANLVNAFGNWMLIFGKLGAPAMGAEGAGWSTTLARAYMMAVLLAAIVWHERRERTGLWNTPLKLELTRIARLLRLGCPAALQITMEVGVFAAATALAGRLTPVSLAAHQIAMQVASVTFMVPLGMASAGAVRVGQALGRNDPDAAERAGWMALSLGAGFMGLAGLGLLSLPQAIMRIFTVDAGVISLGASLLLLAAVFQLFDGVQVVATGILRGTGDTRTPMVCNFIGHWLIGLPVSYAFCFLMGWGVFGLWIGLSLGLILVGAVLLRVWSRRVVCLKKEWRSVPLSVAGQ
jgi:multidrug resistance protein, MATE family